MTISYAHISGTLTPANRGILVRGQPATDFINVTSDQTADIADLITMGDILTGLNALDSNQTWLSEVLPGFTYILRTFILFSRNVTLDLRNTNVDILSSGTGLSNGSGLVFRAFGATATEVLTGNRRARLLSGNTLIIVRNRDEEQRIYGPFNRNSAWLNQGGNTTILSDGGPTYDWSANETGTNDQVPANFALYSFQRGYRVGLVNVSDHTSSAHLFLHPDSQPRNYEVRDARPGGSISVASTTPFTAYFFGGRFDNFVFGGLLTGPVANKRAGLPAGDNGLTVEMRDIQSSSRTLTVNRRESFFDILGIIGTQRNTVVTTGNSVNGVAMTYIGDTPTARAHYRGLLRLAYKWKPRFIGTNNEPVKHNNGSILFDVLLGTVTYADFPGSVTNTTAPFMESGDDFGVTLDATDGEISWTDPWTRARPETGRTDLVRDHVRLPWAWTRTMGDEANLGYWCCSTATWRLFIAGYLPPHGAQTLTYPFLNRAYGNWDGDIVISYDEGFGTTAAAVLAARTAAKTDYDGANVATSHSLYRQTMWALEVTNTAASEAWSDWNDLQPAFGGGIFRLNNSAGEILFNQSDLTKGVELNPAQNEVKVKLPAQAGQSYGAGAGIRFNGPIPNCTIDTTEVNGTIDTDNPINGLHLLSNAVLFVTHNSPTTITVNGVTGHTLTVENVGSATTTILTDTPNHVSAGSNAVLAVQINVTGMVAGPTSHPARVTLYRVASGAVVAASETSATGQTSHVFAGLMHNHTYRLVWACPGYNSIYREITNIGYGQHDIVLEPQLTPFADEITEVPTGTLVVTSVTPTFLRYEVDCKRVENSVTLYNLNGVQTNALFETAKATQEFARAIAEFQHTHVIRHPSRQETSLLQSEHEIAGLADGEFRHAIQGVLVHDSNGELTTDNPNVKEATVTGVSDPLPEVVVYPSVVPLTFYDGARLIEGIEGGGQAESVSVNGLTEDGKEAIIEAIQESGAV